MSSHAVRSALVTVGLGAAVLLPAGAAWAVDPAPPGVPVTVTIPDTGGRGVDDAQLRWGINVESTGGAYIGGCNFLSAGLAGDTGSARVWTDQDTLYRSEDGEVRIERPDATGAYVEADWATRCLDADGAPVSSSSVLSSTRAEAVFGGGVGEVDVQAGTATVRWTGSVTSAFYGGMAYWSFTDPVLTVRADGSGTLTASASGFGADMADLSHWARLPARQVTLARLSGVEVTATGLVVTPDYLGVDVVVPTGSAAQVAADATNASYRGSFPQSFVDFHGQTGLASYWYSSGAARDRAKPASPVLVSFDAAMPVTRPPAAVPVPAAAVSNPLRVAPAAAPGVVSAATPQGLPGNEGPPWAGSPVTLVAGEPGLIPAGVASAGRAVHAPVLWGVSGVLTLAAGLLLGVSKGWLVLPWR